MVSDYLCLYHRCFVYRKNCRNIKWHKQNGNVVDIYRSSPTVFSGTHHQNIWNFLITSDSHCSDFSFRALLNSTAELDELLAKEQLQYEIQVEEHVLKPLTELDVSCWKTSIPFIVFVSTSDVVVEKFSNIENFFVITNFDVCGFVYHIFHHWKKFFENTKPICSIISLKTCNKFMVQ